MKILVVDDDPAILTLCARALASEGHTVKTCNSGSEAIAAAIADPFDLALCDINMPDIEGLDVVRAIKMQVPGLPVIVISALDPVEWRAKSREAGADHFLQKPVRLETLRQEVALVGAANVGLHTALYAPAMDEQTCERLVETFLAAGFPVHVNSDAGALVEGAAPELLILDGEAPGASGIIRWARATGIPVFVLVENGKPLDRNIMQLGASLMVEKSVSPDALLVQARFLAQR